MTLLLSRSLRSCLHQILHELFSRKFHFQNSVAKLNLFQVKQEAIFGIDGPSSTSLFLTETKNKFIRIIFLLIKVSIIRGYAYRGGQAIWASTWIFGLPLLCNHWEICLCFPWNKTFWKGKH